jgi:hypothetical protein
MPHRKPYDARHENNQEQKTYPFFTGGPFDVERLIVLRPIKNQGRGAS